MKTSGLDVHKDSIFCVIYDGKNYSAVKEFSTATDSIRSLGEYLKSEDVTKVPWKVPPLTGFRYGIFCMKWSLR
jgi:hypothetical protein